jgi:hypothetical protein
MKYAKTQNLNPDIGKINLNKDGQVSGKPVYG